MKVFNGFFALYRGLLYILIIAFLAVALGPMVVGIRPYVVLSASMEPKIMTGSLVYIQQPDSKSPFAKYLEYKEPEAGDIIAFEQGGDEKITVVHRIKEINADGSYVMKGDNNSSEDIATVRKSAIVGQFKFTIPKLGFLAAQLRTTKGIIIAAALALVAFVSSFISDGAENVKTKKKKEESEQSEPVQVVNNIVVAPGNAPVTDTQASVLDNSPVPVYIQPPVEVTPTPVNNEPDSNSGNSFFDELYINN